MASIRGPVSVRMATVGVACLGALLVSALVLSATGHPGTTIGEAAGNPSGLAGITFKGPPGTAIENTVCPPISDADRPFYYDGPQHIAHVNGVIDLQGTPLDNYIMTGSVDLYHLEGGYEDPQRIEGPHPVNDAQFSVLLGSDGFIRGL